MKTYVKFRLTGKDVRTGDSSTFSPRVIWRILLALQGLRHIGSVGGHHQEEYFEVDELCLAFNLDALRRYGEVEEVPEEHIKNIFNPGLP